MNIISNQSQALEILQGPIARNSIGLGSVIVCTADKLMKRLQRPVQNDGPKDHQIRTRRQRDIDVPCPDSILYWLLRKIRAQLDDQSVRTRSMR